MNIREGTHTLYVIQAKPVERAEGASGKFEEVSDAKWFFASQDAFGFPKGNQAWQQVGEPGWLDLEDAKAALAWARDKKEYPYKDGYGRISSRTKYAFRLCQIFAVRKDQVLEL